MYIIGLYFKLIQMYTDTNYLYFKPKSLIYISSLKYKKKMSIFY